MGSYQQYGGNPYGQTGGYGEQNPYGGGGYGSENPYGGGAPQGGNLDAPPLSQEHSQSSDYGSAPVSQRPTQPTGPMSNPDFLQRVEAVKSDINDLSAQISSIGTLHQRTLNSPEGGSNRQLEHLVTQTQVLNTRIKDQIKFLETDAARSGENPTKNSQIRSLKQSFKAQLEDYQRLEQNYRQKYQETIARQYRIVNPNATEDEVTEASTADWGNEGVFQTALKTNRSAAATSTLGAVRARHNDIQQIEKTLIELNQLFQDLAEAVLIQEPAVQATEEQTEHVKNDTEAANDQLAKATEHARRMRRLKWWTLLTVVAIIVILGLILGLYFGLQNRGGSNKNNSSSSSSSNNG